MTRSQKIFYGIGVATSVSTIIGAIAATFICVTLGMKIKKGANSVIDYAVKKAEEDLSVEITPPAKEESKLEIVQDEKPE